LWYFLALSKGKAAVPAFFRPWRTCPADCLESGWRRMPHGPEGIWSEVMTKREMKRFENMLLEEREKLVRSIRNIEDASRNESGRDHGGDLSSYAESGTDNFNLETALNIASAESDRIAEIEDALRRIEAGTYGVCEGSGKPIPVKRLEAFPSARYCIEYQEELERQAKY